ncbi:hypothetical protein ACP3TY_18060 [Pseudomonas rustica]|uniref:hypothetical protein n=1 Tax=Pseudomonas TaxID=286 RepID=UPI003816FED4
MKKTALWERFFYEGKVNEAPARMPPGSSTAGCANASLIRRNSLSGNSPKERFLSAFIDLAFGVFFSTATFMVPPVLIIK